MTTLLRSRRPLVLAAAFASLLAVVVPASAATVIRTSTADRGLTWVPAQVGEVAGPDQVRWAIGPSGALLESSDGGETWQEITALTALAHGWFRPFDLVAVA